MRLSKQDWPVFKRWERGGAFVDAQLAALSASLNPHQRQLGGGGSTGVYRPPPPPRPPRPVGAPPGGVGPAPRGGRAPGGGHSRTLKVGVLKGKEGNLETGSKETSFCFFQKLAQKKGQATLAKWSGNTPFAIPTTPLIGFSENYSFSPPRADCLFFFSILS